MRIAGSIALSLLIAAPGVAQDSTISQFYRSVVKTGMDFKFEEGMKRHGQWHKAQRDTWTWNVWQVVAGDRLGEYISISSAHRWADFDRPGVPPDQDIQDAMVNLIPFTEHTSSGFSRMVPEASRPWPATETPAMVQTIDFTLKPGADGAFLQLIQQFATAAAKANWPGRYLWLQRVTGGQTPLFTVVVPVANFAAMQRGPVGPAEVLETALGRQQATAFWERMFALVASEQNMIWAYRRDLSYGPGVN